MKKNDHSGYDFMEISDSKLNMNKDQVKQINPVLNTKPICWLKSEKHRQQTN